MPNCLFVYIQFLMTELKTIFCVSTAKDNYAPSCTNIGSTHHMGYYRAFSYMHNQNLVFAYMQPGDGRIFSPCVLSKEHCQLLSMLEGHDFQPFATDHCEWQEAVSDGHVS
jgi:hypothetical protein